MDSLRKNHVHFDIEKVEVNVHNIEKASQWETRGGH